MKNNLLFLRSLFVPGLLFIGACCAQKPAVESSRPMTEPPAQSVSTTHLGDIFFDFDKSDIRMDARDQLQANSHWLSENPSNKVVIEGHCDERGTGEYNMALGERRAISAKEYLMHMGVAPERMNTVSFGKERPFAMGHNEDAWAQNRRAHFVVQ